jgi:hypothetical protein
LIIVADAFDAPQPGCAAGTCGALHAASAGSSIERDRWPLFAMLWLRSVRALRRTQGIVRQASANKAAWEDTVKRFALAAALALSFGTAHAGVVDLVTAGPPELVRLHGVPDLAVTPGVQALLPSTSMSELPEPEVFAMMLVGLVLIGYRARRDSSEKFK